MRLDFDQHGQVHFCRTKGKMLWVNRFEEVNSKIVAYLNSHQEDLDYLWKIYADGPQTSFYIVDLMTSLQLEHEEYDEFVIQGGYKRDKDTVSVNYHMYPANNDISHFGIGTTNNSAVAAGRR